MHVLEYGQEQEKTLLFLPCTAEPVWAFADTVALLSRRWHVFQVIYDGHQPEYAGDFTSVEQTVDSVSLEKFTSAEGEKYAFVFGNEVDGVSQEVVDESDFVLEIPQFGTKHSLNVSVSVGVVLWQARRF